MAAPDLNDDGRLPWSLGDADLGNRSKGTNGVAVGRGSTTVIGVLRS
jgi:hypothetical protein